MGWKNDIFLFIGGCIFGVVVGDYHERTKTPVSQDEQIIQRSRELYIEYKACEKVEDMINGK